MGCWSECVTSDTRRRPRAPGAAYLAHPWAHNPLPAASRERDYFFVFRELMSGYKFKEQSF